MSDFEVDLIDEPYDNDMDPEITIDAVFDVEADDRDLVCDSAPEVVGGANETEDGNESADETYEEPEQEQSYFDVINIKSITTMVAPQKFNSVERTAYIIPESERTTSDVLSKFEYARILSIRSAEIEEHNNPIVPVDDLSDPTLMAKREISARMCPLVIRRYVGEREIPNLGVVPCYEDWSPNEMIHIMY